MNNLAGQVAKVSVDLDNLWCYQRSFGDNLWLNMDTCLPVAVPRLLTLFDNLSIKATFFVVARDTENIDHIPLWQSIRQAGHEIASHSYAHDMTMPSWNEADIAQELARAHHSISEVCEIEPTGFRAPAFGINTRMLNQLAKLGYRYDASGFYSSTGALARWYHQRKARSAPPPQSGSGYGNIATAWHSQQPRRHQTVNGALWRLAVTTMPVSRTPFHGTYLHYLAQFHAGVAKHYAQLAFALCRRQGLSPSFLLHATDVLGDGEFPELAGLPGMRRSLNEKYRLTESVLKSLASQCELLTHSAFCDRLDECGGALQP